MAYSIRVTECATHITLHCLILFFLSFFLFFWVANRIKNSERCKESIKCTQYLIFKVIFLSIHFSVMMPTHWLYSVGDTSMTMAACGCIQNESLSLFLSIHSIIAQYPALCSIQLYLPIIMNIYTLCNVTQWWWNFFLSKRGILQMTQIKTHSLAMASNGFNWLRVGLHCVSRLFAT